MNHLPCALGVFQSQHLPNFKQKDFSIGLESVILKAFSWEYLDIGKESWKAGVDDGQPQSPFFASCCKVPNLLRTAQCQECLCFAGSRPREWEESSSIHPALPCELRPIFKSRGSDSCQPFPLSLSASSSLGSALPTIPLGGSISIPFGNLGLQILK